MDAALEALLLVTAGAAMGFINNLAGAGGVLGLLAFDLVSGLPATAANTTLRPAAVAIGATGALGFLSKGRRIPRRAFGYGLAAVPGAVLGAVLAVRLPGWVYEISLTLIVVALITQQWRSRRASRDAALAVPNQWVALALFTLVGAHMGFVQVGFGLLVMAVLGAVHSRDLVDVNAAKMAIVMATSISSVATLAVLDAIVWPPALWLAAGAAVGSFLAGRWSVGRGHGAIRSVVLGICAFLLIRQAWRILAEA